MDGARAAYRSRMNIVSPHVGNKVLAYQRVFQKPDGLPVFLKGKHDVRLYRGTMAFSVVGLAIAYFSIYQMATGQMTKKEPAD